MSPLVPHQKGGPISRLARLLVHGGVPVAAPHTDQMAGLPVGDILAPDGLMVAHDHLCLDGAYTRTLALTAYPRKVSWGWLVRIATLHEPLTLALHVTPLDSAHVLRDQARKLTALESSRLFAEEKGRLPNAERTQAIADISTLIDRLERGEERVFQTAVYAQVEAPDRPELEERTRRVEAAFGQRQLQTRRTLFEPLAGLESTLPTGRDALGVTTPLDGATLATMYPFGAASLCLPDGVWFGRNVQSNTLVVADLFSRRFTNANSTLIGSSGSGKSVTVKVDILRSLARGVRFVVIDPGEAGEYVRLAEAVGGQVVRLAAGSAARINPLDLPRVTHDQHACDDEAEAEDNVLHEHIAGVGRLLDILLAGAGGRLDVVRKAHLEAALLVCYERAGISADRATHGQPAPTLSDLHAALVAQGDPYGLAPPLARYCHGALSGLFAGRTTVTLDAALTVFDLRGLDDPDLRAAAMHLVTQYVWGVVRHERQPRRLIVDEAHRLVRTSAGSFLASLAKQARKHGFGVTAISQDPQDFLATEAGRALLLNSAMQVLFRCEKLALATLAEVAELSGPERAYLLGCPRGRGLLLAQHPDAEGERVRIQLEVLVSPEMEPLVFTDPHAVDNATLGQHSAAGPRSVQSARAGGA